MRKIRAAILLAGSLAMAAAANAQTAVTPDNPPARNRPRPKTPPQVAPPAPAALPSPSITGPLAGLPPAIFDAGPFGKIAVNGILDGLGTWTGNHVPGDNNTQAALSNGQGIHSENRRLVSVLPAGGRLQIFRISGSFPRHR